MKPQDDTHSTIIEFESDPFPGATSGIDAFVSILSMPMATKPHPIALLEPTMPSAINFGFCNPALISQIIEQELEDFLENLHIHPAPNLQYLRSGLIAWFCVFLPEAVMKGQRDKIIDAVTELKSQDDYTVSDWYRLPFLEVSAYALTRNLNFLETIISNIDHNSSQLRRILHAPLALVAPDLNFNTPGLHQGIVSNFAHAHFFNNNLLCILCALSNDTVSKLAALQRLADRHDLSPQDKGALDLLIKNREIKNMIIAEELSDLSRYVLCRLLTFRDADDDRSVEIDLFANLPNGAPIDIFWERMKQHLLLRNYVQL